LLDFLWADPLKVIKKKESGFEVSFISRKFARGEAIKVELIPESGKKEYEFYIQSQKIPVWSIEDKLVTYLGIEPEDESSKKEFVIVDLNTKENTKYSYSIDIFKTKFQVIKKQSIKLDPKFTTPPIDPETEKFIAECKEAKTKAFESNQELMIQGGFVSPVVHEHITSPFFVRRDYNGKKGRPHGGVDFRGKVGDPIYAIQSGKVVLARMMYYEGNFTIIDHGGKIFSFYMHQSELNVKEGDRVQKGQLIGKIGSTGMSTGPHLHLGAKIYGKVVDPHSLLAFKN
jgi:murein DD-endopeptidase MepM/ murein hydrolase activator NlpD